MKKILIALLATVSFSATAYQPLDCVMPAVGKKPVAFFDDSRSATPEGTYNVAGVFFVAAVQNQRYLLLESSSSKAPLRADGWVNVKDFKVIDKMNCE